MFEQAFRNIDDVLWKEAGCTTELDYTEQTSWLLFLKYLDSLEQDVGSQVRTAILDLESARAQLTAAEAQLAAAERALEVTDQRYKAGAATLVELTESRATQVAAASAEVTARYDVEFRRRLLDYYVGGLTPESVRF